MFKFAEKLVLAVLALLGFSAGTAQAAVPVEVGAAITTMATDAVVVASAVLVAIIGVVAIKFIRKGL